MNKFLDIPKQKTFTDLGLDQFGQSPLSFAGAEINRKTQTMNEAEVPSNFIQTGDIIQRLNLIDGYLQSNNFATGSTGWRIDSDGNVEFNNGTFRGTLSAASGTLGAITIGTNAWHVDASGNMWWGSAASYAAATIKISSAGSIDFTTGTFSGTLSAASGTLGAITVGTNAWHIDSSGNMWWGSSSTYAGATIKISSAGSIDFTTGNFSGTLSAPSGTLGTITAGTITGATIQTATSGRRMSFSGASNKIQWLNNSSEEGYIYNDGSGNMIIDADNLLYLVADGAGDDIFLQAGGDVALDCGSSGVIFADGAIIFEYNQNGGTDSLGIYDHGSLTAYFNDGGDLWVSDTISGGTIVDRTPHYNGNAMADIRKIKGKNGEIDHDSLPDFIKVHSVRKIVERDKVTRKMKMVGEEPVIERNLGACVSVLLKAVVELDDKINALKKI